MKNFFLLIAFSFSVLATQAQVPQKMNYQAVIRNTSGTLVSNSAIGMKVSILQGSISGTTVYSETHTPSSNANGLVTLEVGNGNVVSGSFTSINWRNGPYFIKTETDPTGGSNYSITATSQLLSVPYALYAGVADSISANSRAYLYLEKKATIQTIPNNTNTAITNYDSYSASGISVNMSTGEITFNKTGIYIITAQTSVLGLTTGRKIIWFETSSSLWSNRIASNEMSGDANRITTSFVGRFNAGDTIQLRLYQNTGQSTSSPNTTQTYDKTLINIERLY